MKNEKSIIMMYMAIFIAVLLMFTPAIASAQYSDSITDSTNDVDYYQWTDTGGYSWKYDVARDNIDIVRASIEESGGNLIVELEVKGTIQSDEQSNSNMMYEILMEDDNGEDYDITYYFGQIYIEWPQGTEYGFTTPSGFGTSTLQIEFSLDTINNPNSLEITDVTTYEYTSSAGSGEYYMDEASPGSDDSSGDTSGGTDDTSSGDIDEGMIQDIMAGSMLCIAVAIIVPIVIIAIIIIVLVKVIGGSDDEGGQQPPQQSYQQPPPRQQQPPQQQPPQQQGQQSPPPPGQDQGSGQTPPPPSGEKKEGDW